jgi:hypothetical protein
MGVFSTNLTEITSGGLISSSHTSDVYNVLSGNIAENVVISGSFTVSAGPIVFLSGSATQFVVTESIHTTLTSISASITSASIHNIYSTVTIESASISHNTTDFNINGTGSADRIEVGNSLITDTTITSTSASISYVSVSDKFISEGSILFYTASLPTTDPLVNGQLWRSGSYLMISTGSI